MPDHAFLSPRSQSRYDVKSGSRQSSLDQDSRGLTEYPSTSWAFMRQSGKWKRSQTKKMEFDQLVQELAYKEYLKKHELEFKARLPLPLMMAMQIEVLQILEACFKDYQHYLGSQHNLTQQMKRRINELRRSTESKLIVEEVYEGRCHQILEFFRQFLGTN